jgi:hypothetical protein
MTEKEAGYEDQEPDRDVAVASTKQPRNSGSVKLLGHGLLVLDHNSGEHLDA